MIIRGDDRPDLLLNETLPDLFEITAQRHGDRVALIDGSRTLRYRELDAAANRVAEMLIAAGAGRPGNIVGLWGQRGAELLIAQLGIAKSGAAWLPFDSDAPARRVAECLEDAHAAAILVDADHAAALSSHSKMLALSIPEILASAPSQTPLKRREGLTPQHPAYVIYTSGSTGKPKGIVVDHAAICHFLRSENSVLNITAEDRVYQGFSVSFDMSFEEIWISYLAGASLWIAPKAVTTDPDALREALIANRITVLHAVPSLMALIAPNIPELRTVNLGGEACPQAVADTWAANGRRVFNTYGPTETAVSATFAELRAGAPVTIGRPMPNYGLAIVNEELRPVTNGAAGELCIFGPGLAIGYLGRADLTREKYPEGPFPELPGVSRLYRTGDQVQIDERGELRFLGRIDDQVKVRGFRVELGEIENAIASASGIRAAAVVLRCDAGIENLVAFVVAEESGDLDARLRRHLSATLPCYMVPSQFVRVDALPRLPSGKVDRKTLRAQPLPEPPVIDAGDTPTTPAEAALFAALAALFPGRTLRRGDDFFSDLGGHSLTAARLVSRLRSEHGYLRGAVRDVYAHRRLDAIATALAANQPSSSEPATAPKPTIKTPPLRRWLCGLAQFLVLPIPVCAHLAIWLAPFFTYHYFTGEEDDSLLFATAMSCLVFLLAQAASFLAVIVSKWLVLGRLRPGRYPLWGVTYFRWWFSQMMTDTAPDYLLNGTPLYRTYLRMQGARIGPNVYIGSMDVEAPDLLDIGANTSVGSAVHIANARVEDGYLVAGPVVVGESALLDSYAVLENDTRVGARSTVGPLTSLPAQTTVPADEVWEGVPARFVAKAVASGAPRVVPGSLRRLGEWLFYPAAAGVVSVIFFLPVFPAMMLIDHINAAWLDTYESNVHTLVASGVYLVLGIPAAAVLVAFTLLVAALLRRTVCPRLRPGSWPIHGWVYYRKWISSQIQDNSLNLLHGLFATIYAPMWFRLIGAKVGKHTEISTAAGVTPELLTLGDDCFIADGVMLGDEHVRDGHFTLIGTQVGSRSFVGNGACVPDGSTLPADVLIGVQSLTPPNASLKSGQTWMGNPPICLPAREVLTGYPESLTFRPSFMRRVARGTVELIRIVLPLACIIAFGYLAVRLIMPTLEAEEWATGLLMLATAGFGYGVSSLLLVLAAKWLLVGRYRPRTAPIWTLFVWLSEAVTAVYESLTVPYFLTFLRGTPLLPFCLRLFGTRIGRGVYLNTTDMTEFDCVEIGDGAELNADCGPQTHLFEDRIMKIGHVRIGAGAVVGVRCTILYDTEIGNGVRLGALTLVAKGERLPAGTDWAGSPAAPVTTKP